MTDFEIVDLPDGSFDLLIGDELVGNYPNHRSALRAAVELAGELTR